MGSADCSSPVISAASTASATTPSARASSNAADWTAQIILNSTHNHSGPVTRNSLMPFHDFTPDDLHRIGVYTRDIEQKAIDAAAEAFGCLAPATLSLGAGQADFAVNRRNNPDSDIPKSLPHRARLRGPVDHRVPVIAVRSPAGGLLAVVFAYSCHPVMTPESVWSGDFPGFAMLDLEQAHPKAMALFCQGCGGDQNCVRGPIAPCASRDACWRRPSRRRLPNR